MMQCTIFVNTFIWFHLLSWTLNELKSWSCSFWQLVGLDFGYVHHYACYN